MKAYAILAGGGVKGVAHAGCLAAAEKKGLELVGFGGASAGSIVAALAAVEYSGEEICEMLKDTAFTEFLDDKGEKLERIKEISKQFFSFNGMTIRNGWTLYRAYSKEKDLIRKLYEDSGLYQAPRLEQFLRARMMEKPPKDRKAGKDRKNLPRDFTFRNLRSSGYTKALKIIASDVVSRRSVVFSAGDAPNEHEMDWSVITAVRASTSYPFVFEPVPFNRNFFSDGGISSNLPVFLFEQERKTERKPILAFDLVHEQDVDESEECCEYRLFNFCSDLLGTTLESSDKLLQGLINDLHYIPVPIPRTIDTLKFKLSKEEQDTLYERGFKAATSYFENHVPHWFREDNASRKIYKHASDAIKDLQRGIRVLPTIIHSLLEIVAQDFESHTGARNVRCAIMLPADDETQVVVYHYRMDADPDIDFQMDLNSGCAGHARINLRPFIADLEEASRNPGQWGLTREQQNKIPKDRKAGLAIPLFDVSTSITGKIEVTKNKLIGTLNIDTSTALSDTKWRDTMPEAESGQLAPEIRNKALFWGAVFSKLLS